MFSILDHDVDIERRIAKKQQQKIKAFRGFRAALTSIANFAKILKDERSRAFIQTIFVHAIFQLKIVSEKNNTHVGSPRDDLR